MTDSRQMALDALKFAFNECESDFVRDEKITPAIAAIEADIAAKVEPVAWMNASKRVAFTQWDLDCFDDETRVKYCIPLYEASQQAMPAGFVLVPIEPTWEMLEAAELSLPRGYVDLYKVLIEAAPRTAP